MNAILSITDKDGVCVATLEGEVDLASARHVADEVLREVSSESLGVVLDLSGVRYLDSTGISLLFEVHRSLDERRQRLALVVPPASPLHRLFNITSLGSLIPIAGTLEEAREAAAGE